MTRRTQSTRVLAICRECARTLAARRWPDGTVRFIGRPDACPCGGTDFDVCGGGGADAVDDATDAVDGATEAAGSATDAGGNATDDTDRVTDDADPADPTAHEDPADSAANRDDASG